ncbi:MAG: DUF5005 domain-containing protein [Saprospiraceae bacterium]|nr:DUF5005 domain-containing protein [Saprospiraceae bacterium]
MINTFDFSVTRTLAIFFIGIFLLPNWSVAQSYKDTVFTNYFRMDPPGWISSDGALSLPLPDGRTMWMMGDSHIDQLVNSDGEIPCFFNARSCVLVQDNSDLSVFETYYNATGSNAYERQFVNMPGDSLVTYWPASGTVREDTAYTFWLRFIHDPSQPNNMVFSSMAVAKIKLPEIELIEVIPIQYPDIVYGMTVFWDPLTQYYYIYGREIDFVLFKPLLARCTYDNLLGDWEFYSGNNFWSENPTDAVYIADEVSAQFTVFNLNGEYHLYFQKNGFLNCGQGRDMFIYSSDNPWGPFEDPVLVYTMNDTFDGEYPKTYNGQAHPQFISNDELLISYNLNKTCPGPCAGNPGAKFDPDMYRPQFARVPICMFANDVNSPVISSIHKDLMLEADENCQTSMPDFTVDVTATDNCDSMLLITQSPAEGTIITGSTNPTTLTVTDNAGNITEVTFNVAVEDLTNPTISCGDDQTVTADSSGFYIVNDVTFDPISTFDNCGVASLMNDFNSAPTLAGAQLPIGINTITWVVTDSAGNSANCQMNIIVENPVGIELLAQKGIAIYPNPTTGILHVTCNEPDVQRIKLFDLSGKNVFEKEMQKLNETVDLSHLQNGVYILHFNTGSEVIAVEIIKI